MLAFFWELGASVSRIPYVGSLAFATPWERSTQMNVPPSPENRISVD